VAGVLIRKRERLARARAGVFRGKRLNYNASLQTWYSRQLRKLIALMTAEVKIEVIKLFNRLPVTPLGTTDENIGAQSRILMNKLMEKFEALFSLESKTLSDQMLERTVKSSESNIENSLKEMSEGLSIKAKALSPELSNVVTASIAENVSLIKSIPAQYFKDVTGAVMRSITTGAGLYDLMPEIKKYEGITERRAELLALDQTRKAYTAVNAAKLDSLGIQKFEWIHSGGGQTPRESNLRMDGKIFSFANLQAEQAAMGVPKDDRGLPGYPINCRCTFAPVVSFD
jgi:SPP1 gp7 family putative phage head morphogenesis protein